jgi:type II secretion system protein C
MPRLLIALALAACAHTDSSVTGKETLLDEKQEAKTPPPPPSAPTVPATPPRTIARAELVAVLDRSPGAFLSRVDPSPVFRSGRFHGWRLVTFFPGDARFAGVDLRAGDVVTRVNGRTVEKPDQLMEVWQALRTAPELTVDVERNGAPRTLRWSIHD